MQKISSPWLHQLAHLRAPVALENDLQTEIVIVGAGIAGIVSAFFILKYTKKRVIILEANKLAHGATGHNAGQIVSYFEHPFARLVELYGEKLAARAQEAIFYAWDLLDEIFAEAELTVPLSRFTGYAGCSSVGQIVQHLENIQAQRRAGLDIEGVLVAHIPYIINQIPKNYRELYARVDHREILNLLETSDIRYIGVLASRKGCVNSALLCEQLVEYLTARYAERFTLYENSPVSHITLEKERGFLTVKGRTIAAHRIILCTNGFSHFSIKNTVGEDIDARFHKTVIGKIGYMAAYLEAAEKDPLAISYFTPQHVAQNTPYNRAKALAEQDPYFYLTRRKFEHKMHGLANLVCIGGPENDLTPGIDYDDPPEYPSEIADEITRFMRTTFRSFPRAKPDYAFTWQGLMGYTSTGVRCIGPDPANPVLLYNLGCNGVGILSSVYGGKRISNFLLHTQLEPSIFDPRHTLF